MTVSYLICLLSDCCIAWKQMAGEMWVVETATHICRPATFLLLFWACLLSANTSDIVQTSP